MKTPGLVRALIVDDSVTARVALKGALAGDPGVLVVGEAETGDEALRLARRLAPDIVLMDVYLRGQSGLDVAAELMSTTPCPILAVTAANPSDPALVFRGMDVGVLDICLKPPAPTSPGYEDARRKLTRLVKVLAGVPVVTRTARTSSPTPPPRAEEPGAPGLVLLGASTGGPPVLREILSLLPAPFPLPVVVVQHLTAGFGAGFAAWLGEASGHPVTLVQRAETLAPGRVYIAADDRHARVAAQAVLPDDAPPLRYQRPSVDVLFTSAADSYRGPVAAALLTGMGSDGAEGLLALRRAGALTLAQSPETCVVPSMPSEAIALGAAMQVLTPAAIAGALRQHAASVAPPRRP